MFEDAPVVIHDDGHPERSLIIGTSDRDRLLLCVYIESEEEIRIISAHRLAKREKKNHEEGTSAVKAVSGAAVARLTP